MEDITVFFIKDIIYGHQTAQTYLYKRLWGILYDGIFLYPRLQNKKNLLSTNYSCDTGNKKN